MNRKKLDSTVRLPRRDDDYYFDGYPRSGNTFFRGLLKEALPNLNGASHLHTIAGIKLSLSKQIKSIIIIRNPKDAVLSNVFTKINRERNPLQINVEDAINDELHEWMQYYQFALNKQDKVYIIIFEYIVNDKRVFLHQIEDILSHEIANKGNALERFNKKMRDGEANKEVAYSSLPNETRKVFKKRYEAIIESDPLYSIAFELYNSLANKTK